MLNVGPGELIAILALALIILGPNRLPEAVRTAGRVMGELRRISSGFQEELRSALEDNEVERDLDRLRSGPEHPDRPELGPVPDLDGEVEDDDEGEAASAVTPIVDASEVEAAVAEAVSTDDGDEDHEAPVVDGADHPDDDATSPGDERAAS